MSLRQRTYLTEATFNFDRDVDYIYKQSGLKKVFAAIQSKDAQRMRKVLGAFPIDEITWIARTDELRSKAGKKADKLNPGVVVTGIMKDGSHYKPREVTIQCSVNYQAYGMLKQYGYEYSALESLLGSQIVRFWNEFTPSTFKSTVYHELAHWADDTMHNKFIKNKLTRANELGGVSKMLRGKHADVRHTPMEINSQIHSIKVLRKRLGKKAFDKLTWMELFQSQSSLAGSFTNFRSGKEYLVMMKGFLKRLNRENLLGKGLRKFPTFSQMRNIHYDV